MSVSAFASALFLAALDGGANARTELECTNCVRRWPATSEFFKVLATSSTGFASWCRACDRAAARRSMARLRAKRRDHEVLGTYA